MATSSMTVPTTFTAIDKFSHVVAGMTKGTKAFTASMGRINQRVNSAFNSLDRFSQIALGAGVGSVFYKAGDDVVQYEKAIASLAAVTGTKVGSMTKDIQALGKESGHSVIEITKGFEQVGSKMSEYLSNPTALKAISKQGILMAEASRDIQKMLNGEKIECELDESSVDVEEDSDEHFKTTHKNKKYFCSCKN